MKNEWKNYLYALLGGVIYAFGVNLFTVPLHLYSCGLVGIAQIIRTLLIDYMGLVVPAGFDIAGIINFCLNVPLLIMAYKVISKKFFVKTLLNIVGQTMAFALIAIPQVPIIEDHFAACVVGGVIGGIGIGLSLRAGGSGAGLDVLGMYLTSKLKNFSIGTMTIIANSMIYIVCALLFDLTTAVYSLINLFVFSYVLDRIHYQNIDMSVMIFAKNKQLHKIVNKELHRGATYWSGNGAYSDDERTIFVTVVNKYELVKLKKVVKDNDPDAFVVINGEVEVLGNFEKRL